jgi:hypothetical protein
LLEHAGNLAAIDDTMARVLQPDLIAAIVGWIPESWLTAGEPGRDAAASRAAYTRYLLQRAAAPRAFLEEATRAR